MLGFNAPILFHKGGFLLHQGLFLTDFRKIFTYKICQSVFARSFCYIGGVFNFGFLELMTLAVIGLIVLGPEQFPKVARGVLKVINELKRAFSEARMDFDDIKGETEKLLKKAEEEFASTTEPFRELEQGFSSLGEEQKGDFRKKEKPSPVNQVEDFGKQAQSTPQNPPEALTEKKGTSPVNPKEDSTKKEKEHE